ncbi:hypothetical protein Zmor_001967 [Zophobas morio]|uniref:Uncharacterized protein n=1 Tax=Zophobas morio TaxID=2755281 RepID=A0AA38J3N7_9CUCU|nr:hypothetical protein Zmor_001967 [Zophobas morio]
MSNVTLREALEKAKIPASPKFLAPPVSNPATSYPNRFIDSYERVALTNSWYDALKVSCLPIFLEKATLAWFRQYTTTQSNADQRFLGGIQLNSIRAKNAPAMEKKKEGQRKTKHAVDYHLQEIGTAALNVTAGSSDILLPHVVVWERRRHRKSKEVVCLWKSRALCGSL